MEEKKGKEFGPEIESVIMDDGLYKQQPLPDHKYIYPSKDTWSKRQSDSPGVK